jgi:SAM-dependent methyltransferase
MDNTLNYYNNTASEFVKGTINADLSALYDRFLNYLPNDGHILDLGCGSGRDARAFIKKGYTVTAIDGSSECCKLASDYIGQDVFHLTFKELEFSNKFDGVWACASLLHVPFKELTGIIKKVIETLRVGGFIYASFKYGDFEGNKNGRYFTNLDEERLSVLLKPLKNFEVIETFVTGDVRKDRDGEMWLNVIGRKKGE